MMIRQLGRSRIETQQKITTFLWSDNNAEEAIQVYLATFSD